MARCKFHWNYDLLMNFVHYGILDNDEYEIMKGMIQRKTTKEIAKTLSLSPSTVNRRIHTLREKYDELSKIYPNMFPPREKGEGFI